MSIRAVGGLKLPLSVGMFQAIAPLLRHGALDASAAPVLDLALAGQLQQAFTDTKVRHFIADARKLAEREDISIRNGAVYLRTENALTGRFVPPAASGADVALGRALHCIEAALALHRGDRAQSAICALVSSQILLTIHPFRDGNGRTARMFHAAKVLRHLGPAPSALLGLLLLQRSGAHQYHQATWALRAGDAEPMVALFVDAERLAVERILPDPSSRPSPAALLEHCWSELRALS